MSDDWIQFQEEEKKLPVTEPPGWKVLIVDDDEGVHVMTKLSLEKLRFQEKRIDFISAYSGEEGFQVLSQTPEVAVVLLDVVMESDDAGLVLAKRIREELKSQMVRIILRTGQPGMAPEERVILEYDINDYKDKTELTVRLLFTSMITALRAYRDLKIIENSKQGLEMILEASSNLFRRSSLKKFTEGVLTQIASLLQLDTGAFYSHSSGFAAESMGDEYIILCGTGNFSAMENRPISTILSHPMLANIQAAAKERLNIFGPSHYVLFFYSEQGSQNMIYLEGNRDLSEWEKKLVQVFLTNVSAAYDNLNLNWEIETSQKEIIFTLGELTESRSPETGSHVHRVSDYVRQLALLAGLDVLTSEQMGLASALHDVGKIAIPDEILKKPSPLTPEERKIMRSHSSIGNRLLGFSHRPVIRLAAQISLQHHEHWDGSGYPHGDQGDAIHLAARMTTLADVFDALSQDRVYRLAWPREKIEEYFVQQKGILFDPELTALFLQNLDFFYQLRDQPAQL